METNKFGENVGEIFGTVAWLWVFHRFRQDGAVLLGFEHPWEHGHSHDDGHSVMHTTSKKLKPDEVTEAWEKFNEKSMVPGEDDDDDDDDDDDVRMT